MDSPTTKRHDLAYFCTLLGSLTDEIELFEAAGVRVVPSYAAIRNASNSTVPIESIFSHDGARWRADTRIKLTNLHINGTPVLEKKLIVHLPNDGIISLKDGLYQVGKTNLTNNEHGWTCPQGWALLKPEVWAKLQPFEEWARKWYGYPPGQKLQKQVLINDERNRMDIKLRCLATNVAIGFCFEPGVPEDGLEEQDENWD